ncbi:MAG: aminodeoxychorismate synthase, component I [Rhodospirillaceae bacterium]|nr:aminodeoxychorismate synthase, component I [Rhodospirillaceae bacterium]
MRPHAIEIPYRDPVSAFTPFAANPYSAFLDAPGDEGRYAYIAPAPVAVEIAEVGDTDNPWDRLAERLAEFQLCPLEHLPPFQTGLVGYFGYEMGRHLEQLPAPHITGTELPEMVVGFYDVIAAFDVERKKSWVVASPFSNHSSDQTKDRAETLAREIAAAPTEIAEPEIEVEQWQPEIARTEYDAKAKGIIDYIQAGDIFQANLTQRFLAERPARLAPFDLYRQLRHLNPAPFAAYLGCGSGRAVLSASPERFLSLGTDRRVVTEPIKGSRPRGATAEADRDLAKALENSAKDKAENLMIVDLLRNDLSRVCEIGSVAVPSLNRLESFAEMHHLVSTVTGTLKPDETAISLLKACFPGGSVTGAPKIRAMEIINEIEPARRGPYCGAIGWIGFDGAMDTSIVIRTLVVEENQIIAQAGGGIVADSQPTLEYEESMSKARALLRCLDPKNQSGL